MTESLCVCATSAWASCSTLFLPTDAQAVVGSDKCPPARATEYRQNEENTSAVRFEDAVETRLLQVACDMYLDRAYHGDVYDLGKNLLVGDSPGR